MALLKSVILYLSWHLKSVIFWHFPCSDGMVALQIHQNVWMSFTKSGGAIFLKWQPFFFFFTKNKLMCSGGSKWRTYSHPSSAWWIPLTKSSGAKIYAWRGFLSGSLLCKIHGCSLDGDLSTELIVSKMVPFSKDHARWWSDFLPMNSRSC